MLMCLNYHSLIYTLKKNSFYALLDTGANLSLIQPQTIEILKKYQKLNFLSRSVNIKTINNASIPYFSAVQLKFKINNTCVSAKFLTCRKTFSLRNVGVSSNH